MQRIINLPAGRLIKIFALIFYTAIYLKITSKFFEIHSGYFSHWWPVSLTGPLKNVMVRDQNPLSRSSQLEIKLCIYRERREDCDIQVMPGAGFVLTEPTLAIPTQKLERHKKKKLARWNNTVFSLIFFYPGYFCNTNKTNPQAPLFCYFLIFETSHFYVWCDTACITKSRRFLLLKKWNTIHTQE